VSEETMIKTWEEHPMLKPKIEKVVVNLNVGKSGEPLEKANKVLKEITGRNPVKRKPKQQSATLVYAKENPSQS
jgi:large subunit ribosomal protein L5